MNYLLKFFVLTCILSVKLKAEDTTLLLDELFEEIKNALNAEAAPRQHEYPYRPQNNGISLGVYEALRSIARNDDLECISRLLCEAAAGGQPGFSGRQIKFDKLALTNLMSYLKLDPGSSSPLLVFGRAALLGVSNRGDPYSCIINYPKCPKDQSRLLHYLNNHRGGFFQYFDKKYHKPGNYYSQNHYRPGYYYQKYQNKFNRNKIQFESSNNLYEKLKKKAKSDVYAQKYGHFAFPGETHKRQTTPMVFPKGRSESSDIDPRILTKTGGKTEDFFFSNRYPKKYNDFKFFPQGDQPLRQPGAFPTDRLPPNRFYFPENEGGSFTKYPVRYSQNSFFPTT